MRVRFRLTVLLLVIAGVLWHLLANYTDNWFVEVLLIIAIFSSFILIASMFINHNY